MYKVKSPFNIDINANILGHKIKKRSLITVVIKSGIENDSYGNSKPFLNNSYYFAELFAVLENGDLKLL